MSGHQARMPWRRRRVIEEGGPPPPPPRMDPWPWLFLLLALVVAGVIAVWWWTNENDDDDQRATTTVVVQETTTGSAETETDVETVTVEETETGETAPTGGLVEVPDVTGPPEDEARRIAEEAGFDVRVEDSDAPTAEEVGEVVLQKPDAGTRAPAGSEITLYVGR